MEILKKEELLKLKMELNSLSDEDQIKRNLFLRKIALGEIEGKKTGYPSIDKSWLQFYLAGHIITPIPHMTAFEYMKYCNRHNMFLPAINSPYGNYTYKELIEEIEKTATALYQLGVRKGDIVLTMLPICPQESIMMYAVDIIGAAISYLPPYSTEQDICDSIKVFNTKHLFIFENFLNPSLEAKLITETNIEKIISMNTNSSMRKHNSKVLLESEFKELAKDHQIPNIERNPEDLLFVAKTGGSTGLPKNVMLNDNCFNSIAHQYINSKLNFEVGDTWLRVFPLFSATAAVSNSHAALCCGTQSILREIPENDIRRLDELIIKERPNHIMMAPTLIDDLEKSKIIKGKDLHFIKSGGCGGASITPAFENRCTKFYKNHNAQAILGFGWGQTENSSSATIRSSLETATIGFAGVPLVNTNVTTFKYEGESSEEELPYGEEGEICISSPNIMMGYYQDPRKTNEVIKVHKDGTKWLHTGDIGKISSQGLLKVNDRASRMLFVYPCDKVYPSTIETIISQLPGVRLVAAGGVRDYEHESCSIPVCFIIPEDNYNINKLKSEIEQFCKLTFPEFKRPKIFIDKYFPLTPVGKIDINTLLQEADNQIRRVKKL